MVCIIILAFNQSIPGTIGMFIGDRAYWDFHPFNSPRWMCFWFSLIFGVVGVRFYIKEIAGLFLDYVEFKYNFFYFMVVLNAAAQYVLSHERFRSK
jgi:hypothetical protein